MSKLAPLCCPLVISEGDYYPCIYRTVRLYEACKLLTSDTPVSGICKINSCSLSTGACKVAQPKALEWSNWNSPSGTLTTWCIPLSKYLLLCTGRNSTLMRLGLIKWVLEFSHLMNLLRNQIQASKNVCSCDHLQDLHTRLWSNVCDSEEGGLECDLAGVALFTFSIVASTFSWKLYGKPNLGVLARL